MKDEGDESHSAGLIEKRFEAGDETPAQKFRSSQLERTRWSQPGSWLAKNPPTTGEELKIFFFVVRFAPFFFVRWKFSRTTFFPISSHCGLIELVRSDGHFRYVNFSS